MTDIEKQALALVNAVAHERGQAFCAGGLARNEIAVDEALCRALEMLEAHKREVSDALKDYFGASVGDVAKGHLGRFIIPDPVDPLVEALKTSDPERDDEWDYSPYADALRTAMKARGYAFTKIEEGQP